MCNSPIDGHHPATGVIKHQQVDNATQFERIGKGQDWPEIRQEFNVAVDCRRGGEASAKCRFRQPRELWP